MELTRPRIGMVIFITAVLLGILTVGYFKTAESIILGKAVVEDGVCIHDEGTECPFQELTRLARIKYPLYALIFGLGIFGLALWVSPVKKKLKPVPKNLSQEEKSIYALLREAEGMMFQNEIVEKTDYGKVKVTRILDKMESKGILERRRRGMANVVILRN